MLSDEVDQEFQDAVVSAVQRTVAALAAERPLERLAGYALTTDDSLETVGCIAVTREGLLASDDGDLLYQPPNWPLEPDWGAFELAYSLLQRSVDLPGDGLAHVHRSFEALVRALEILKAKGLFGADVYLSVLSTDPSDYLVELESSAVKRLCAQAFVDARSQFLEKWK